jgi:cytochrome P450
MRQPLEFLDGCRVRYGRTFRLRLVGGRDVVVLADPEAIREVFRGDPAVYTAGNKSFDLFFGPASTLVLDGEEHKRHRRLLGPSFRGERMAAYATLTRDLVVEALEAWPRGAPFELLERMEEVTFHTIVSAVFGRPSADVLAEFTQLWRGLQGLGPLLAGFVPALRVDLGPWSPWGRFRRNQAAVDRFVHAEIARARAEADRAEREDILATLVRPGPAEGLSDDELRDEALTMLSAGHETTTASLSWTVQSVLANPEVLARARAEVDQAAGQEPIDGPALKRMPFLDAVVNESLRLNPPLAIVSRKLAAPVELAGHRLPAGAYVYPCVHLVHRDPELYPQPLEFRPERFEGDRPSPFEYFPFGGGARTCLGLSMALFQTKLTLATLLQRADLRLHGPPSLAVRRSGVTLMPATGTPVVLDRLRV